VEILTVDEALNRLAELDAQQARIVELRYFVGLTVEETAEALGISPRTVKRDWAMAAAWLRNRLSEENP
jgi:RNA polymerase sigma factor (sigma-70 family)